MLKYYMLQLICIYLGHQKRKTPILGRKKEEHFTTSQTILTKSKFENLAPVRNFWDFRQFKVYQNPLEPANYIFRRKN